MARKQAEIPGFERQVENEAIELAAQAYCEVRDQRAALSKKEKQKQLELQALMKAHKVPRYEYIDDNGEVLEAVIVIGEEKAVVRKTGEAESEVGEGVETGGSSGPDVHAGLIRQAEKAADDANVGESVDGDVVVPEKMAPKSTRKGKGKKPS
jgi:hypothetical protein